MSIQTVLRSLIASGLVLGSVSSAFAPAAFAATDNDTQSGQILPIETVNYTAAPTFTITPDSLMTDQGFGSVNVQSNANAGWTLAVASTNGSLLQHTTIAGAPGQIAYTLKVDGTTVNVGTAAAVVTAKDVSALTCAATGGCNYTVQGTIAAAASNGKPAGTYSDVLTFTLTNK